MRSTILGDLQTSFGGLGGPVGVQMRSGASWEGLGGSQGGSWRVLAGGLEKVIFSFSEVNLLMV